MRVINLDEYIALVKDIRKRSKNNTLKKEIITKGRRGYYEKLEPFTLETNTDEIFSKIKFDNAVKYGIIEARNILGLPLTDEEEDILKNILYENDNALLEGYKKINLIDRLELTNLQSRNNVVLSEGTCIESIQKLPASTLIDKWIFVQRSHDLYAAGFSDLICYATIVKEMQFRCYVTSVQGAQFQHNLSKYAEITLVDKIPHYYYDNTKVNRRND